MSSVVAVGDIIVDVYRSVTSNRIAREALVPVCIETRCERFLGGAALCAVNLASLGVSVTMAGFVGNDDNGKWALTEFERLGVDTSAIITCPDWVTPSITRISGDVGGVVSRLDSEVHPIPKHHRVKLKSRVRNVPAMIVASEYCKGTLDGEVIGWLRSIGAPLVVDPRYAPERFVGAHTVKMNHHEFGGSPTQDALKEKAICLKVSRIIVTLADKGLVGYDATSGQFVQCPGEKVRVFDVTGAGDVVHATVSMLTLEADIPFAELCRVSESMGRLSVQSPGTVIVNKVDLAKQLNPRSAFDLFCKCLRDHRVVFTCGCYDVFHHGHLTSLRFAKSRGDFLVVGINSDASVKRLKGGDRPLNPESFREWLVSRVPEVDATVVFDEDTPERLLAKLRPAVFVKGDEYSANDLPGTQYVQRVELNPMVPDVSTTKLLEKWA